MLMALFDDSSSTLLESYLPLSHEAIAPYAYGKKVIAKSQVKKSV